MARGFWRRHAVGGLFLLAISGVFFILGIFILWATTWKLPDIASFEERKITESTKIYDRTGEILLFDLNAGARRTIVPYTEISRNVKNATVAIEDDTFWQHHGIRPQAFLRAIFVNIGAGEFSQGGSTITQQVVKNSLLTSQKKISRKIKEWVLSWKLEKAFDKETILALYLNEVPYGGTIYGIEEAAETFFGKNANDLSVAESAYLAALPNAPTYYSPYGNHKDKLEERKNLVLKRMVENGFITEAEHAAARDEKVTFKPQAETGIVAPHFVFFVRQYMEERYGLEALEEEGFRVITTLDAHLQKSAQEIAKKYALENKVNFDAENAAVVAIDPRTGQILAMVGSRDYFDTNIDGNFNAAIGFRQPGSAFKPFVYATALEKGFTPETVVFDVPTEFSTLCKPDGTPINPLDEKECYMPENYDGTYHGPLSFRSALAQSVNIPAVKVLYLAGLKDSLRLAKDLGISTLAEPDRYGLTLVLGGGEVKLLDMTGAYAAFAAEGIHRPSTPILKIETKDGAVKEEWTDKPERVLSEKTALQITDILSDNRARAPAFGENSPLHFPGRDVAVKTGTTNDYRDAWIIGYTPSIAIGAWVGNNDNRAMQKKVAAYLVAPLWNAVMKRALASSSSETFREPPEDDRSALPPILRGVWQGGQTYFVDKLSGKQATEFTPPELREERAVRNIHSILYWIDKAAPTVVRTAAPETDSQFERWEYAVRKWALAQGLSDEESAALALPQDDIHRPEFFPRISLTSPIAESVIPENATVQVTAAITSHFPIAKVNFFADNIFIGSAMRAPWQVSFFPKESGIEGGPVGIKVVAYDIVNNRGEASVSFSIAE